LQRVSWLGLCLALALGCGRSASTTLNPPSDPTLPVTITEPGGGQVTLPPGALSEPTEIHVDELTGESPATPESDPRDTEIRWEPKSKVYVLTPHGVQFNEPVTSSDQQFGRQPARLTRP